MRVGFKDIKFLMALVTFYSSRSGEGWIKYPGGLVDISVGGSEIWGVNSAQLIYRKIGSGNWANINGKLKQVSNSQKSRYLLAH